LGATRQICALVANGERPYAPIVVRCLFVRGEACDACRKLMHMRWHAVLAMVRAGADCVMQ
jgi:hypothetical protein